MVTLKHTRRQNRVRLKPGRVYRTKDFKAWTKNPTRLAKRLVREGRLTQIAHGLYACPRRNRFGEMPPKPEAIMEAFLDHTPFVFTGPEYWNALGLGSTALFPIQIVYNTKRSGEFDLGGRRFWLRRVKFPENVTREWYAVDLIEHRDMVGLDTETLQKRLYDVVAHEGLEPGRLLDAAREYATKQTESLVSEAVETVRAAAA